MYVKLLWETAKLFLAVLPFYVNTFYFLKYCKHFLELQKVWWQCTEWTRKILKIYSCNIKTTEGVRRMSLSSFFYNNTKNCNPTNPWHLVYLSMLSQHIPHIQIGSKLSRKEGDTWGGNWENMHIFSENVSNTMEK